MFDPDIRVGKGNTSQGALYFLSDRDPREGERPMAVVLHGALRHSECTLPWLSHLSDRYDVILIDMPGHGRSPSDGEPSVRAFIARFREFLTRHFPGRPMVIMGESIGGLIALGLGNGQTPQIKGVVVADPPMSTAKLWPVFNNFQKPKHGPATDYLKCFFKETFGYMPDGMIGDRIYYPLVAGVKVPTLMLTGDLPLFPVRQIPTKIPCLLDEVDKAIIRSMRNSQVRLETISDIGHLCLDCSLAQVREEVDGFCAQHLPVLDTAPEFPVADAVS
jgi:pimeloyl-ACP methyl ester carboxylesterase